MFLDSCEVPPLPQGCVLFCCSPLQLDEWTHGELGEEETIGHVKRHLWGFVGPPHDGRGSASGGSNFSKPLGRSSAVAFCACVCMHLPFVGQSERQIPR